MDKEITTAVEWYDPDTAETVRLACEERGLELLFSAPTGREDGEIVAVVKGPASEVERFAADVDEGCADPYEAETRDMSDAEYEKWLEKSLARLGVKYDAKARPADEDEDEDEDV